MQTDGLGVRPASCGEGEQNSGADEARRACDGPTIDSIPHAVAPALCTLPRRACVPDDDPWLTRHDAKEMRPRTLSRRQLVILPELRGPTKQRLLGRLLLTGIGHVDESSLVH